MCNIRLSVQLFLVARTWCTVTFRIGLKMLPVKKENVGLGALFLNSIS